MCPEIVPVGLPCAAAEAAIARTSVAPRNTRRMAILLVGCGVNKEARIARIIRPRARHGASVGVRELLTILMKPWTSGTSPESRCHARPMFQAASGKLSS